MNDKLKWTVRDLPAETLVKLREVREASPDTTMADLIEQAIELWYDSLPTEKWRSWH